MNILKVRVSIIELLYNLLGLSRNVVILEKLKRYKFFEVCLVNSILIQVILISLPFQRYSNLLYTKYFPSNYRGSK
jgi:hypothetical protein